MSSIVSGINYALLYSGSASATDASTTILNALYGGVTNSGTAVTTGDPILDLKLAQQNETKDVAKEAKNPIVVRDLAAFTKAIANSKTINQALQNPDVLKVLLTANGLADQLNYTALASKVLQSDPSNPNSLVNKLSDARWLSVVKSYNFAKNGLAELKSAATQSQLGAAYEKITWLNSLDQATPGLSEALQFKQKASSITSVVQILGDPINWQVVLTALDIPQQIAFQDLNAQESEVSSRLNVKQLQDPNFVNTLTDQYLLAKKQQALGTSTTPSLDQLAVQASGLVA